MTASIPAQVASHIESVVGETEAANILPFVDQPEMDSDGVIGIGPQEVDGCVTVGEDDVVTVWAQGDEHNETIAGSHAHYRALLNDEQAQAMSYLRETAAHQKGQVGMSATATHELTIVHQVDPSGEYDDALYIHGGEIADPENNPNVTVDETTDGDERFVYVVTVPASEDEQPYRDALAEVGVTVTGKDELGNWTGEQSRPLPKQ